MTQRVNVVKKPGYAVDAIDNALQLIGLLRQSPSGIRVQEAAEYLGVAPSTAHRFLSTLVYRGFAVQDASRRYLVGPAAGRVLDAENPEVPGAVMNALARLRHETGETASLLRLRGTSVEFLASVESHQRLRVGERTRSVLPARLASGGKAILAALDDASIRELFSSSAPGAERLSPAATTELIAELARVRRAGYAVNLRRTESDISAVGMVIPPVPGRRPTSAVALSAPAAREGGLVSESGLAALARAAREISALRDGVGTMPSDEVN